MDEKVRAVSAWAQPRTVTELRAFLGLAGYYHRFIQNFAKVAAPLHALLVGCPQKQTRRASPPLTKWTPECETAFQGLKEALTKAPVLAFADFSLPFILYTDASKCGLGAVLSQVQGGVERVIAYASRSLHPTEKNDANYSSFKLEFLALKWAVTEKFHEYLLGSHFTIFTDNNPLAHLQTANLGSVEQRWAARLANYNFELKFRAGKANANADALSRKPWEINEPVSVDEELLVFAPCHQVTADVVQACCAGAGTSAAPSQPAQVQLSEVQVGITPSQWQDSQRQDPAIQQVLQSLRSGRPPDSLQRKSLHPRAGPPHGTETPQGKGVAFFTVRCRIQGLWTRCSK